MKNCVVKYPNHILFSKIFEPQRTILGIIIYIISKMIALQLYHEIAIMCTYILS